MTSLELDSAVNAMIIVLEAMVRVCEESRNKHLSYDEWRRRVTILRDVFRHIMR